jgi:hypothetical protein
MISAIIVGLGAQGIDYILGVRERSTGEVRITVIDDDSVAVPLTIPARRVRLTSSSRHRPWCARYMLTRNARGTLCSPISDAS